MKKKAYFFSLDAFIALVVIIGLVLFIKPTYVDSSEYMDLQGDLLHSLSSVKIGEIDNSYVQGLIANGTITDLNQSVLEQIGEFYANSSPEAETLTDSILDELNLSDNVGIYFNGMPISVHGSLDFDDAKEVWTSRQIISGISEGNSSKGYSSRAYLFSENKIDYFYFGGYVGDGNITVKLDDNIIGANIEGVFSGPFDLYINDNLTNSYNPSPNIPYKINLGDYLGQFSSGDNYIKFKSSGNLYIAGGYVRVVYNSSSNDYNNKLSYFPGIDGVINLYSSFYIPGELTDMEIFLHYNSSYDIFLNVGGERIYAGNSSGDETSVTLNNSFLSGLLDYSDMDEKTIPYRLGVLNVSYLFNGTIALDTFSVTDISGSMEASCSGGGMFCCWFSGDFCGSESTCGSCGGIWEDKLDAAKEANKVFIDAVLNETNKTNENNNRVGLVGYSTSASDSDYHELSKDNVSLKNKVDDWEAGGTTCICCGINRAVNAIVSNSSAEKFRSIVVMSDGQANVRCSEQGTGSASQDAVQAACDAYNDYGIYVYSIGFGNDADESTLQSIASCGNGNYYFSNIDELVDVYAQIVDDILNATYYEQTVVSSGLHTKLYPDSYISVDYNKAIPYGMIITAETPEFGNSISEGSFNVPGDTSPYEVKVVSYSGTKWTDNADVYNNSSGLWENVFNLSSYNLKYINLGDPYVVNIPLNKIHAGDNSIRVSAGLSSLNSSGGSPYDKIIYSLVKNVSSYSEIVSSAEGCTWTIEFEDGTNSTIRIPEDYSGSEVCLYTSEEAPSYNNNDAIDNAIFNLLSELDLDSDGKVETKFSDSDLTINSIEITGIPFTWETEVQVRVWR